MKRLAAIVPAFAIALAIPSLANADEAGDAIAAAKAAMEKTDSVGYLWRDTGAILKAAEDANAKGDADNAMALANKARMQAVDGYEQYERYYNDAGPRF
jgi:hypothetical protein